MCQLAGLFELRNKLATTELEADVIRTHLVGAESRDIVHRIQLQYIAGVAASLSAQLMYLSAVEDAVDAGVARQESSEVFRNFQVRSLPFSAGPQLEFVGTLSDRLEVRCLLRLRGNYTSGAKFCHLEGSVRFMWSSASL